MGYRYKNGYYQKYVLGKGYVNIYRGSGLYTGRSGYAKKSDNLEYNVAKNAVALKKLQAKPSPPPPPEPAPRRDEPVQTSPSQAEQVIQQIVNDRIAQNQAQLDTYQEMISGLEARLAAANTLAGLQIGNYRVSVNGEGQPNATRDPLEDLLIKKTVKSGTVQRQVPSSSLQRLAISGAGTGLNLAL